MEKVEGLWGSHLLRLEDVESSEITCAKVVDKITRLFEVQLMEDFFHQQYCPSSHLECPPMFSPNWPGAVPTSSSSWRAAKAAFGGPHSDRCKRWKCLGSTPT